MFSLLKRSLGRVNEDFSAKKAAFERDGFLALPGFYAAEKIDTALHCIDAMLEECAVAITADNLITGERRYWRSVKNKTEHLMYKFNDMYLFEPQVRDLAMGTALSELLAHLLNDKPVLCNSLNFAFGSQQPAHVDSLYMTPKTPNHLLATWIALEDVHPDAGPMTYWPGSHKIPRYLFSDGGRHVKIAEMPDWSRYMDQATAERGIQAQTFLAKKGDVFIWHSELLHGGSPIHDKTLTRNSLVCHYFGRKDYLPICSDLQAINAGFWQKRLPQGVMANPEDFTAETFPESVYLERHADVAKAVRTGHVSSGYLHWLHHGLSEGRPV